MSTVSYHVFVHIVSVVTSVEGSTGSTEGGTYIKVIGKFFDPTNTKVFVDGKLPVIKNII